MASKRMYSEQIIKSDRFLNLSHTAKILYFYLLIDADDDGFNNRVRSTMDVSKTTQEDLKQLVENGFIIPFQSGIIVITNFRQQNNIRKDRYNPSVFLNEKRKLVVDQTGEYRLKETLSLEEEKNLSLESNGFLKITNSDKSVKLPTNTSDGCHSIGEDRLDKNRLEEREDHAPSKIEYSENNMYGDFNNVLILPKEYKELINTYQNHNKLINKISYYLMNSKRTYQSHYALLKKIAMEDEWPKKKVKDYKKQKEAEEEEKERKQKEMARIQKRMEEKGITEEQAKKELQEETMKMVNDSIEKLSGKLGQ